MTIFKSIRPITQFNDRFSILTYYFTRLCSMSVHNKNQQFVLFVVFINRKINCEQNYYVESVIDINIIMRFRFLSLMSSLLYYFNFIIFSMPFTFYTNKTSSYLPNLSILFFHKSVFMPYIQR